MRLPGLSLAVALALSAGAACAQTYVERDGPAPYGDYGRGQADDVHGDWPPHADRDRAVPQRHYDWARVVRVDPVFDDRGGPAYDPRRCRTRRDGYASHDPDRDGGHGDDDGRDRRDPDPYRQARRDDNGRMVATVLGGIAGAVLGSKVGDGSGRYIGTAVGTMVGGMAGRGIYDANRRGRDAYVTVCEPESHRGDGGYGTHDVVDPAVAGYDVTYEYGGRRYVTRTDHHPGDRIRVRVDVRAE